MKTIFRFLTMATMLSAIAVGAAFAQDTPAAAACPQPEAEAAYNNFLAIRKKTPATVATKQEAIDAGKQFLEKYGTCPDWVEQAKYVTGQIPKLDEQKEAIKLGEIYKRYDAAVQGKKWDEVYAAGKEIIAAIPDKSLDQIIPMGMIGLVETFNKNNKYNDESLKYAKMAIDKLNAGEASTNGKFGVYQFAYGTKENAISELSYAIAHINYYGKGDKKGAVAQFYKVTQLPGSKKTYAPIYATIGDYYVAEATPMGTELGEKIKKLQEPTTPDEEKVKLNEEIKVKEALLKGYTERAMDAYSRAWSVAKDTTPQEKTYKESLMKEIQRLYKIRFDDKTTGVNEWVSATVAKPLPDPTSAVQPVADPETTTTSTGATKPSATVMPTSAGAANGSGVGAANGTGVGAANGSGIGAPTGKTVGAATKPAAANKPVTAKAKPKN